MHVSIIKHYWFSIADEDGNSYCKCSLDYVHITYG